MPSSSAFTVPQLASTDADLQAIARSALAYTYLPFASDSIPGAYVEAVIGSVRDGEVLRTYDFVDVVNQETRIGWQVKSTKDSTPVTWKRAKIPGAPELIAASQDTDSSAAEEGLAALGRAIIDFCNRHAAESLEKYELDGIAFARVIVTSSLVIYYERELLSRDRPWIFDPDDFTWRWSTQKFTVKKEQLSALHGQSSGDKWFAWHGLGENQLHFSGEKNWWPSKDEAHRVAVPLPSPSDRMSFETFSEIITGAVEAARTTRTL